MDLKIASAKLSDDGMKVRLVVDSLRAGYVHELILKNFKDKTGTELLHPEAYYTLVNIPTELGL